MRLFTSGFNPRSTRLSTVVLLSLTVLFGFSSEFGIRYAYPNLSREMHRIESERTAAYRLGGDQRRGSVLIVGNSLLLRGVDVGMLQQQMPDYNVSRFVISNTWFFDWFYGLDQMFARGARPETVVLGLSTLQLIAPKIEGDFGIRVLYKPVDAIRVGRELKKDNTTVSNMFFAALSSYYGEREEIRKWLLTTYVLPDLPRLATALRPAPLPIPESSEITMTAESRLGALKKLCDNNGVHLVFVVPPTPQETQESVEAVQRAAAKIGLNIVIPIKPGELNSDYFPDGLHLNTPGAMRFTRSLSSDLNETLGAGMLISDLDSKSSPSR